MDLSFIHKIDTTAPRDAGKLVFDGFVEKKLKKKDDDDEDYNASIIATKAGVLRHRAPNKHWVENAQRRYVPALEEMVIGVVLEKHAEGFKLDIGSAHSASLEWAGFEPSSRKNRPQWPPGSIVYTRVILANKDMDPEVACVAQIGKAEGYGILGGGIMINCSLSESRKLLNPQCEVLKYLGKKIPYEIAVGLNGRVWVNSNTPRRTILVANTIKRA